MFGDDPGVNSRLDGNDYLLTYTQDNQTVQQTGGNGYDTFIVYAATDGITTVTEIMDFKPGVDHLKMNNWQQEKSSLLFASLDRSSDGVINQADALHGAPVVSTPETNSIGFTNGDDWVPVHGASQINAGDWLFT